ncbi:hypothetical protein CRG98_050019, partial [Punica granatum]
MVVLTRAFVTAAQPPRPLREAQDELDLHVRRHRPIKESDTENLVFLQAAVKETTQLYPP